MREAESLRAVTGLSLMTASEALGIPVKNLYRWERGIWPRNGADAARYARVVLGLQRHCEIGES
jgi:DNA-binding transcriptional regulator YiaG